MSYFKMIKGSFRRYIMRLSRWVTQSMFEGKICLVIIAVLLAVTACGNEHITAPTLEPTRLAAKLLGKLVIVEGCLRVNAKDSDTSYLLAWPPDFAVSMEEDVQLVDENGKEVVLHIGEIVSIGGGEVHSTEYLDERVRQKLPENCPGPYWVVGTEVGLLEPK